MKSITVLAVLSVLSQLSHAVWDTLYTPGSNQTYLRLSTDDIVFLSLEDIASIDELIITEDDIIDAPTTEDFALGLANDDLFAIHNSSSGAIEISQYKDDGWRVIEYNTTLPQNETVYFADPTVMTTFDESSGCELLYILGGVSNGTVTNRILEFNPLRGTVSLIITSVSPTAFYGASSTIGDSQLNSNVVIGGKASSGWVGMFQIAIWEYKSWTFKTVQSSAFSVNSRIYPLVLSSFKDEELASVLVLGGILGDSNSSPYVLSLNTTDSWYWSNYTDLGDFDIANCVGGVIINGVLLSVNEQTNKRDGSYGIELFDVDGMKSTDSIPGLIVASSTQQLVTSASTVTSSVLPSSSSVPSSMLPSSSSQSTHTSTSSSYTLTIVLAVILPVLVISATSIAVFFIYIRWKRSRNIGLSSEPGTDTDSEYYRAISSFENSSISSWDLRRKEYTASSINLQSPKLVHVKTGLQSPTPFANPDDYEDLQALSPKKENGASLLTLTPPYSSSPKDDECIDEFFSDREVQVLVSTRRRSELRVMNPDADNISVLDSRKDQETSDCETVCFPDESSLGLGEGFDIDKDPKEIMDKL